MPRKLSNLLAASILGAASVMTLPTLASAQDSLSFETMARPGGKGPGSGSTDTGTPSYTLRNWMSSDLSDAWSKGYFGQGTTITVVDDFSSQWGYYGNLGDGTELHRHGEWTYLEAGMVAPQANMKSHDFSTGANVRLARKGLNVLNLSYGMMAQSGYSASQIRWGAQEQSIISYAQNDNAVISKAAGNDAVAIGAGNAEGLTDYLGSALVGATSAIFVGALDRNGSVSAPAALASYSNYAGANVTVQEQFLVVGVEGDKTNLFGTSFAAPIVSGYAAIMGSKFTNAKPSAIKQQLLDTARTDTILNYNAAIHGQGEASISRALAPTTIN